MTPYGPIHHARFRRTGPGDRGLLWLLAGGLAGGWGLVAGSPTIAAAGLVVTLLAGLVHVQGTRLSWKRDHRVASMELSDVGAWAWRLDDGSTWFDPVLRGLAGIESGSDFGRFDDFLQRVHPADLGRLHPALEEGAADGRSIDVGLRIRGDDGTWRRLRFLGGRSEDRSGLPAIRGVALLDDDSAADQPSTPTDQHLVRVLNELAASTAELEAARHDLEERNRELDEARIRAVDATTSKSEFLANMSHEIRTPLGSIIGFADLLAEEGDALDASSTTPGRRREFVEAIHRNGEHLLALVNDVLDLSKIEADRLRLDRTPTDARRLAAEVVDMTRGTDSSALEIVVEATPSVPALLDLDPVRHRQVLLNLVGNAIKFTDAGSIRITMDWCAETGILSTTVSDTGIGIKASALERIFQPFRQEDGSTTRRFGGTGLGLAISRRICRLMGGDLVATSAPGEGSTFIATSTAHPAKPAMEGRTETNVPAGLRVMLAEDGPDNRRLVGHLLGRMGIEVILAENGLEAVEAILGDRKPVDLVFMDMQMPVMDGWEATRRLRNAGSAIPIVALTANAMPGDREACLEAGCDGYLPKPVRREALEQAVIEAVERAGTPRLAG